MPDPVRDAATTSWIQHEPREYRILIGGGVVLLLMIVYLVLQGPAFEGQHRIEKALSQVCTQPAGMETLDQEMHGLSAIAATPVPRGAELGQALNVSLTNHGLKATQMAVPGESVQVQLNKVPFGTITEWLQEVWQAQHMKVIDTSIKYVDATALVNVTATLQGPAAPGR